MHSLKHTLFFLALIFSIYACNSEGKDKAKTTNTPPSQTIHTAAFMGDIKSIQQHIDGKSDLNVKDQYGSTALIIAATFDKPKVAAQLIKAGADLSIPNNDGSTPLHIAAFFCRTDIVKMLIDAGADPKIKNKFGATACESVSQPWSDEIKGIYDGIGELLGSLGLRLDYEHIEKTRPEIVRILEEYAQKQ
ncbi:ankyrin repeat domain-containing protein [Puteibacter caeruleilacunae]|nr:ankyrin repeat domain-containing protein [Puteibacter caeruleilacunae]